MIRESAATMAAALVKKEVSAVDLANQHYEQIAAVDKDVHAFLYLDKEGALAQAAEVDKKRAAGEKLSPLAGVPLALKDVLTQKGVPTTCGSKILEGWRPPYDATVVTKLKEAGIIILGKTNMDEFAMGSSTENSAYGPTKNPWDLTRIPGGKPTYGGVSRYGLVAFSSSLDQAGPCARTVLDTALLHQVIAGFDPKDSTSINQNVPDVVAAAKKQDIKGMKIGVVKQLSGNGYQKGVENKFKESLDELVKLGAEIVEVSCPNFEYALAAYYLIAPSECSSNLARFDSIRFGLRVGDDGSKSAEEVMNLTRAAGFGREVKRRIILGTYALSSGYYDAYYGSAQKVRTLIKRDFESAFTKCDVLVSPTAPTTAFKIGEKTNDPLAMYLNDIATIPVNMAGIGGMSLPCGLAEEDNLPVGFQIMSPALQSLVLNQILKPAQFA